MKAPRLYVLTGSTPGCYNVSAVFQRDMLAGYPPAEVTCGVVGPLGGDPRNAHCVPWLRRRVYPLRPAVMRPRGLTWVRRASRFVGLRRADARARSVATEVAKEARRFRAERLLAVLTHPPLYVMSLRVATELDIPVSTIVMDPPEYLVSAYGGADRWFNHRTLAAFEAVLRMSQTVGVASDDMGNHYADRYGISPVTMIHGFERTMRRKPKERCATHGQFTVALAGSLYATDAWYALLGALTRAKWRVQGCQVAVKLIGPAPPAHLPDGARFECMGWQNQADTLDALAQADCGYVPYWFDQSCHHDAVSRLSFPNKMSAYLAAGLPVLFHGPDYSGAGRFVARAGIGVHCASLEPDAILSALVSITNLVLGGGRATCITAVLDGSLCADVFRARFAQLVGARSDERFVSQEPVCGCQLHLESPR